MYEPRTEKLKLGKGGSKGGRACEVGIRILNMVAPRQADCKESPSFRAIHPEQFEWVQIGLEYRSEGTI